MIQISRSSLTVSNGAALVAERRALNSAASSAASRPASTEPPVNVTDQYVVRPVTGSEPVATRISPHRAFARLRTRLLVSTSTNGTGEPAQHRRSTRCRRESMG